MSELDNKNFMPERLITWFDLIKGVGEVALEFLTERHVSEPDRGAIKQIDENLYGKEKLPSATTT